MELVRTGISGLDAMLYGGVPKNNQIIVLGGPGAGKSLLSFEFLYRNAKEGVPGVFFALEEESDKIVNNVKSAFPSFTDIDDLIKDRKIIINSRNMAAKMYSNESSGFEFGDMIEDMENMIVESGAGRAVIDSSSAIELMIKDEHVYRRAMWSLTANLRRLNVTSILTSEIQSPDRSRLSFRPEHFIFDGMVVMYQTGEEARRIHALEVIKMRGYKHSFVTAPYEVTPSGFKVLSPESMST